MRQRTLHPAKNSLKKSFITKAYYKWAKRGHHTKHYIKLKPEYEHLFDRKMIQGSAGLVLAHLNVPKKKMGPIMKATQELFNMEAMDLILDLSVKSELDELWNAEYNFGRVAAGHVEKIEEQLGSLELTEHYFARLNDVLIYNYERQV